MKTKNLSSENNTANGVNTVLAVVYVVCLWLSLLGLLVALQFAFPLFCKSSFFYIPVFALGIIFGNVHKLIWQSRK